MFNQIVDAFKGFVRVFGELPMGKKIAIGVVSLFMLLGILLTAYLSSSVEYSLLYSNLSQTDMLSITEKLKERNIPYKMERAGTVLTVPTKDVYSLRLELAGEGLPTGGAVGFEIFDKSTFGMTEFIQKLNFKRALQGELQRTINAIDAIYSSRVHIVIPQKTLFDSDASKSSASVVLKLKGAKKLDDKNVEGIAYLVAAAVEGLSPNDVTIVDTSGNVLSGGQDDDEVSSMSVKQMEFRRSYEASLEKRIRTMLERVVGLGKAIVRVSADIDFKQEQRTEEIFDPNSQVARSEQRNEEKNEGATFPMGVTGVQTNLPEEQATQSVTGKPASSSKVNETVNYEINKVVKTVIAPTNVVSKLSVAVMLDGKMQEATDADGKKTREFVPLADDEKARIQNLVRTAIGFDENRQDIVTVESMQFDISPLEDQEARLDTLSQRQYVINMVSYAGLAVVAVIVLMVILRTMKWVTTASGEVETLQSFPKTIKQMEQELEGLAEPAKKETGQIRQAVMDLIADNPEQAAELVRKWLRSR